MTQPGVYYLPGLPRMVLLIDCSLFANRNWNLGLVVDGAQRSLLWLLNTTYSLLTLCFPRGIDRTLHMVGKCSTTELHLCP